MKAIMALVPALGTMAILAILRGYSLDRKTHREIVIDLQRQSETATG
jgi:Na+/melibiose symporter-like transporter